MTEPQRHSLGEGPPSIPLAPFPPRFGEGRGYLPEADGGEEGAREEHSRAACRMRSKILAPVSWVLRLARQRWARHVAGWGIVLLIACFWGRSLWSSWAEVRSLHWQITPWPLLLSFPLMLAHLVFLAGIWSQSLLYLGENLPRWRAVRVWLLTQIARYLPGGTWDAVTRMVVGGKEGLRLPQGGVSVVLEMVVQTVAAVSVFLLSFLAWPGGPSLRTYGYLALLIPVGLLALHPCIMEWGVNGLLRLAGRPPVRLELRYGQVLSLFGLHVVARVAVGLGFFLFARAFYPFGPSDLPALIGTFAGAWVVGFVVFFVPMGLGVREGVMTALLGTLCPLPVATAIALGDVVVSLAAAAL